jgi:hypothetical protein
VQQVDFSDEEFVRGKHLSGDSYEVSRVEGVDAQFQVHRVGEDTGVIQLDLTGLVFQENLVFGSALDFVLLAMKLFELGLLSFLDEGLELGHLLEHDSLDSSLVRFLGS